MGGVTSCHVLSQRKTQDARSRYREPLLSRAKGVGIVRETHLAPLARIGMAQESGATTGVLRWKRKERLIKAPYYEKSLQKKLKIKIRRAHPLDGTSGKFILSGSFRPALHASAPEQTFYAARRELHRYPAAHAVLVVWGKDFFNKRVSTHFTASVTILTPPFDVPGTNKRAVKLVSCDHITAADLDELPKFARVTKQKVYISPVADIKPYLEDLLEELDKPDEESLFAEFVPESLQQESYRAMGLKLLSYSPPQPKKSHGAHGGSRGSAERHQTLEPIRSELFPADKGVGERGAGGAATAEVAAEEDEQEPEEHWHCCEDHWEDHWEEAGGAEQPVGEAGEQERGTETRPRKRKRQASGASPSPKVPRTAKGEKLTVAGGGESGAGGRTAAAEEMEQGPEEHWDEEHGQAGGAEEQVGEAGEQERGTESRSRKRKRQVSGASPPPKVPRTAKGIKKTPIWRRPDFVFGQVSWIKKSDFDSMMSEHQLPSVPSGQVARPQDHVTLIAAPGEVDVEDYQEEVENVSEKRAKKRLKIVHTEVFRPQHLSASPGQIEAVNSARDAASHDATSFGGSSGGALIDSKRVARLVGVHQGSAGEGDGNIALLVAHDFFRRGYSKYVVPYLTLEKMDAERLDLLQHFCRSLSSSERARLGITADVEAAEARLSALKT